MSQTLLPMKFLEENLEAYIQAHTTPEPDYLYELNRETNLKVSKPQMLSGHLQGKALEFFSSMLNPYKILEVGTYTGYSAICLAKGLKNDGVLHTIENNEEFESIARKYWQRAGVNTCIRFHIGDAVKVIPELEDNLDLVFIDADKENYSRYYDLVFDKVRKGGFIIADNVLWSGKVLNKDVDKDTRALQEFNEKIHHDNRVDNFILPLRDGLMIAHKI